MIFCRSREATVNRFQQNILPLSTMEDNPQYDDDIIDRRAIEHWSQTFHKSAHPTETEYSVFPSSLLNLQKVIGEGAFGKVHLALLYSLDSTTAPILVAVRIT